MNATIDAVEQAVVVGGEDERGTAAVIDLPHYVDNAIRVGGVEIGGRFVGDHEHGIGDQGPGDGDTLLLTAGEFLRAMMGAFGEFDFIEQAQRLLFRIGQIDTLNLERKHHVLKGAENRDEVEVLKNESDRLVTQGALFIIAKMGGGAISDGDLARGRIVEKTDQIAERSLARSRRTPHRDELVFLDRNVHSAKSMDFRITEVVGLGKGFGLRNSHGKMLDYRLQAAKARTVSCESVMIEWFFSVPWALWLLEAFSSMVNAVCFRRWSRQQDEAWAEGLKPESQQSVALVVAIKGFDPEQTPPFFHAICGQEYRSYRLLLTMESPDDPVAPWIRERFGLEDGETNWESGNDSGLKEVRLIYAGPCEGRGQKVHNQIAAFEQLEETDSIVAFADADMHCGRNWLARLVAPINTGTNPVSTTYRYFVPRQATFINFLATAINASVATLGGRDRWNSLWGGSMAIGRPDFEALDVPTLFSGSLNDDLRLGRASRRSGRKPAFVRSLLVPSPVDFSWSSFFEFGRRQYVQVRLFAPIYYKVSHLLTWTYLLGLTTALIAAIGWASTWAIGVLVFVGVCDQIRAVARRQTVRAMFSEADYQKIRPSFWIEHFLTPFAMLIHAALTTSALFRSRIRWAGIEYRIIAPDKTEVLGRD